MSLFHNDNFAFAKVFMIINKKALVNSKLMKEFFFKVRVIDAYV